MKLTELLNKIAGIEAAKPLIDAARTEFGDVPDMDLKEYGARIRKAEDDAKQLATLSESVKQLDGAVKAAEPLKAQIASYEKTISDGLLEKHFSEKATAAGIKKEAVAAAFKLANLSSAKVDIGAKAVTGLTQDVFDGLKKDHGFLFNPPTPTNHPIPPVPPAGNVSQGTPAIKASAYDHFIAAQNMRATQ